MLVLVAYNIHNANMKLSEQNTRRVLQQTRTRNAGQSLFARPHPKMYGARLAIASICLRIRCFYVALVGFNGESILLFSCSSSFPCPVPRPFLIFEVFGGSMTCPILGSGTTPAAPLVPSGVESRSRGRFGRGIYLAENASKSDEYAKEGSGAPQLWVVFADLSFFFFFTYIFPGFEGV